jgi:hypothetical protein
MSDQSTPQFPNPQPEKTEKPDTAAKFFSEEEKPRPKDIVSLVITLLSSV